MILNEIPPGNSDYSYFRIECGERSTTNWIGATQSEPNPFALGNIVVYGTDGTPLSLVGINSNYTDYTTSPLVYASPPCEWDEGGSSYTNPYLEFVYEGEVTFTGISIQPHSTIPPPMIRFYPCPSPQTEFWLTGQDNLRILWDNTNKGTYIFYPIQYNFVSNLCNIKHHTDPIPNALPQATINDVVTAEGVEYPYASMALYDEAWNYVSDSGGSTPSFSGLYGFMKYVILATDNNSNYSCISVQRNAITGS